MSTRATATFEITGWTPKPYDAAADAVTAEPTEASTEDVKLTRVTVTKNFKGDVEGSSTAELLMCQGANESGGYLAQEQVVGRLGEREGSFVIQHGGLRWPGGQRSFGNVVTGSGTGELQGIRGEAVYAHDETGATLTLDYEFE